jgi:hypothetical protein
VKNRNGFFYESLKGTQNCTEHWNIGILISFTSSATLDFRHPYPHVSSSIYYLFLVYF